MRKLFLTILILVGSAVMLSGCGESYSWNQKLTVEVQTPNGDVSGVSVTRVGWSEVNSVGNYPASYSGEAAVVDLKGGHFLFVLLREETKYLAFRTFNGNTGISEEIFAAMSNLRVTGNVPIEHYPMLVTFDDINDPATVKKINPNNLAASFGAGYSLKSIALEITDEEVTQGDVEKVLGWLNKYKSKNYRLNGKKCIACPIKSQNLSDLLSGSDFKVGK